MTAVEEAGAGGRAVIFEEQALEGILENAFRERALEGALEARSWLEPAETKEGWMGPAEMKERGEGAVRSPVQYSSIKSPSMSSSPRSQMYNQLTLSRGAGGGAPLRAHTVHGWLPRGGHCRRLSHLI